MQIRCSANRGYYMAARRYEISLRVLKNSEIQILRLLIVLSRPNQCNNRKILHFQFIKRKRRKFTVIISGTVRLLVSPSARGVVWLTEREQTKHA